MLIGRDVERAFGDMSEGPGLTGPLDSQNDLTMVFHVPSAGARLAICYNIPQEVWTSKFSQLSYYLVTIKSWARPTRFKTSVPYLIWSSFSAI